MDINRDRRFDRAYAERLLGGDASLDGALADLLAAASAPVEVSEARGEDAAAAAFTASRAARPLAASGGRASRTPASRWLTMRFAVIVLAIIGVGVGGAEVAAATGLLPALPHLHSSSGRPSPQAAPSPGVTRSNQSQPGAGRPTLSSGPVSAQPAPGASAPASLRSLCRAYLAGLNSGKPSRLTAARFDPLVAAAGARSNVVAYCRPLLKGGSGTPKTPHPTGKPSQHPTGKSSKHPADAVASGGVS